MGPGTPEGRFKMDRWVLEKLPLRRPLVQILARMYLVLGWGVSWY